ncbi:MAG: type II toxin-antitoxin system prevent-host-death family antitoxin [Pontiella sp.]
MNKKINIYEAKTHLSELIKQVQETGEPYTICKNNKPVVDIVVHKKIAKDFDPLKQDPKLKGTAVYLDDPLGSTEDLWPKEYR